MACGTVMIIGLGEVGGKALEMLSRRRGIARIVACDINAEYGRQKVNNTIYSAQLEGRFPEIDFVPVDLRDVEKTAEILTKIKPDVIFNSATLQSYWVIELLPREIHKKFQEISYGAWLPMHLSLCYKLMQAIEMTDISVQVVNGAYPDATNPTLGKIGMAPVAGIGNLELIIPQLRKIVSCKMNVPMRSVFPLLIMHHYAEYWIVREGHTGGAPYFLKILVNGDDVTAELNMEEIFKDIITVAKRPGRPDGQYLVAASAVQKIMALFNNTSELCHVAGPAGLAGGYPVRLSRSGAELVLPGEISMEQAEKINLESQKMEGIEEIGNDGTVIFTDKSVQLMRDLIGYECKSMKIHECEQAALELGRYYKAFEKKYIT